jgi:hypothetical protein
MNTSFLIELWGNLNALARSLLILNHALRSISASCEVKGEEEFSALHEFVWSVYLRTARIATKVEKLADSDSESL